MRESKKKTALKDSAGGLRAFEAVMVDFVRYHSAQQDTVELYFVSYFSYHTFDSLYIQKWLDDSALIGNKWFHTEISNEIPKSLVAKN